MPVFTPNQPFATVTPTVEVSGVAPGTHRFQLVVEDEDGNQSAAAVVAVTVALPLPTLTALNPEFGEWGEQVLIAGANFDPQSLKNRVEFNGVAATVVAASSTQLTVSVPQPATSGPVVVVTGQGSGQSPLPFIIPVHFAIATGMTQPIDLAHDPASAEVWVVCSGQPGTVPGVVVLGLKQRQRLATLAAGRSPHEIALSPPQVAAARRLALVTDTAANSLLVIGLATRQLRSTLKVGPGPLGVAISPDGRWGYVVNRGDAAQPAGSVSVVDLLEIVVRTTIPVGVAPTRVVFGTDGKEAFVNNSGDGTVSVIDVAAQKVVDVVKVGGTPASSPQEVALCVKTYPLCTANQGNGTASVIAADHSVFDVGLKIAPAAAAMTPKGDLVLLAGPQDKSLAVVATRPVPPTVTFLRMAGPGGLAKSVAASPDGRGTLVVHPAADAATLIDLNTLHVQAVLGLPKLPVRGLVTDDNRFACIVSQNADAMTVVLLDSIFL